LKPMVWSFFLRLMFGVLLWCSKILTSKQPFKDEQMNTFCAKSKDKNLWPILPNCLNYFFFFASTILLKVFAWKTFDNICTMLKVAKTMNLWMPCLNNQFMANITLSGSTSKFCIH
jgi:hypothetical protein